MEKEEETRHKGHINFPSQSNLTRTLRGKKSIELTIEMEIKQYRKASKNKKI